MPTDTVEPEVIPKRYSNLRPFQKGNPGKPKGCKNGPYLTPILKKFLSKNITFEDPSTKKLIEGKVKDAIIWRLILNAAQGEHPAIKEILDRIDGMPRKADEDQEQSGNNVVVIFAPQERLNGSNAVTVSV